MQPPAGAGIPKAEFDALKTSLQGENQKLQVEIKVLKTQLEAAQKLQTQQAVKGGDERTGRTVDQEPTNAGQVTTPPSAGGNPTGSQSVAELRKMLMDDSDAKFAQMTADGSEEVTYEGVRDFLGIPADSDDTELKQLFSELDVDGSGKITKQEFLDGLKATQSLKGSQATVSLLRALGMVDVVSMHLTAAFQPTSASAPTLKSTCI